MIRPAATVLVPEALRLGAIRFDDGASGVNAPLVALSGILGSKVGQVGDGRLFSAAKGEARQVGVNPVERRSAAGEEQKKPRLAVLLSGTGRTLENLLAAIDGGELAAEIVVVVSSHTGVRGLEIAGAAGISALTVDFRSFGDSLDHGAAVLDAIAGYRPDLVVLAGYIRRLPVPERWRGRILNIHPALLPEAGTYAAGRGRYGMRVHQAVLAHGDRVSGATVHVVDDAYDEGPVVARVEVPVLAGDDAERLAARVFAAECRLYPAAIATYLAGHPELFGRVQSRMAT